MLADGKTLGELFFEKDLVKLDALDIDFNKKNRVTAAQFASQEAIANTPHSPRPNISITENQSVVNHSAQENSDTIRRSRAATGEVVTISKGEMAKLHANYAGKKVEKRGKFPRLNIVKKQSEGSVFSILTRGKENTTFGNTEEQLYKIKVLYNKGDQKGGKSFIVRLWSFWGL